VTTYGIKYASNFQPRLDRRDVKDKDEDLTHEPEQIKAYRDTWQLGIHSYLTYLRDRLLLARELLAESGSIFVQINDENLHLVRCLLDEVFGRENFVAVITFKKGMALRSVSLPSVVDYLIWYARSRQEMKYYSLYIPKTPLEDEEYRQVDLPSGENRKLFREEILEPRFLPEGSRIFATQPLIAAGSNPSCMFSITVAGNRYSTEKGWKTNREGIERLLQAERIHLLKTSLRYKILLDDYPVSTLSNIWNDVLGEPEKLYAVQTNTKVVERCILMTTDPGDLVFDPTCVRRGTRVLAPTPTLLIRVHHLGSPPEEKLRISLSTPSTPRQHFTISDINPNNNTLALRRHLSHKPTSLPTNSPSRAANKHPNAYTNHTQSIPTAEPTRHRCHPKHPRLSQRNPCSIHIRYPYHDPQTARAGKSVNRYHGSCAPSPQNTTKVHRNRYRNASPASTTC
jgi:hypothetical protein